MTQSYLEPSQQAGAKLFSRGITGEVFMMNMLHDYSLDPELTPVTPISGEEAFQKYIDHTLPYLSSSGGNLVFLGKGGPFFIGPEHEHWDLIMIVKQSSLESFLSFATDEQYLSGIGHRTAALMDSRLLPLTEFIGNSILD